MFNKLEVKVTKGEVEWCKADGKVLRRLSGGFRTVFKFGRKYVIKFDAIKPSKSHNPKKDLRLQNSTELKNYAKIKSEDRRYFAEIVSSGSIKGFTYIVQEYVKNARLADEQDIADYHYVQKVYGVDDVWLDIENSDDNHNLAVTADGIKIYDLGMEDLSEPRFIDSRQLNLF